MHLPARRPRRHRTTTTELPRTTPAELPRIALTTVAALALAVGLTACGSDDSSGITETSAATGSAAATTGAAEDGHEHDEPTEPPTAESLQADLEAIVNPDVSVDEKVDLVTDGENLRGHFEKLNAALQTYRGITFQVAEIAVDGQKATAQTTITSPSGQSAPPTGFEWEYQDDRWKLSSSGACILLSFAQIPCAPA